MELSSVKAKNMNAALRIAGAMLQGGKSWELLVMGPYQLVCEIHDDGPFRLTAYRRILISLE